MSIKMDEAPGTPHEFRRSAAEVGGTIAAMHWWLQASFPQLTSNTFFSFRHFFNKNVNHNRQIPRVDSKCNCRFCTMAAAAPNWITDFLSGDLHCTPCRELLDCTVLQQHLELRCKKRAWQSKSTSILASSKSQLLLVLFNSGDYELRETIKCKRV